MPSIDYSTPFAVTPQEWEELANLETIQRMWGLLDDAPTHRAERAEQLQKKAVGVRFNIRTCAPAYVMDLFVLVADDLVSHPTMVLRDTESKQLNVIAAPG